MKRGRKDESHCEAHGDQARAWRSMTDPLKLLRNFVEARPLGAANGLPGDELRFVLETNGAIDTAALATRIAVLLQTDACRVEAFEDVELADFAILRFPGIERTLPPRELFAIGYALCDALSLRSAEPDLGAPIFDEAEASRGSGLEAARPVDALCWVNAPEPPDYHWALKTARFDTAWAVSEGAGVLVGQPDSGITAHAELDPEIFRLDLARDILNGDDDPTDPLRAGTANPGHGTGTASVLASRKSGKLIGAAPAAQIIPIRCLEDVKIFDAAPVTQAILHATKVGCDVISMSLGGIPSRAMHAAIKAAIAKDIIVIAAAGNCVGTVVWPARYDDVIAVAGSNIADRPWKGSSRGDAVDITAPAELVWRAARSAAADPLDRIAGGQGTSFATALTAGAAALWVATREREALVAEARRRGISVQDLFRRALKHTARRPAKWDTGDFGPGVLDADALVRLPLNLIPEGVLGATPQCKPLTGLLDEAFGPGSVPDGFDWPRYQSEIAAIVLTQARLGFAPSALVRESKWSGTRPSAALDRAVRASGDARLVRFGEAADGVAVARPPAFGSTALGAGDPVLRVMARGGLESVMAAAGLAPNPDAARAAGKTKLDSLESLLRGQGTGGAADGILLSGAQEALDHVARGDFPRSMAGRLGLEALILLQGRPALRIRGGTIDLTDARAGEWRDRLVVALSSGVIESHFARVGRIDSDSAHVGTGFVIGDGLILTNRHVLQAFAAPIPRRDNPERWQLISDDVTIDFAERPSSQTTRSKFRITAIADAGPNEIDYDLVDLSLLDAALLRVETVNASGTALPQPGCLVAAAELVDLRRMILVTGYPARPFSLPLAASGDIDVEVVARLGEIFGADYGTKYAAPGEVISALGSHKRDAAARVFTHDATTLVGNSGSAIIALGAPQDFVGLHFGGEWRRENYAHALSPLRGWSALDAPGIRWCAPE